MKLTVRAPVEEVWEGCQVRPCKFCLQVRYSCHKAIHSMMHGIAGTVTGKYRNACDQICPKGDMWLERWDSTIKELSRAENLNDLLLAYMTMSLNIKDIAVIL